MDDPAFGAALQRLYEKPPPTADAPLFAWEVERRIARTWALRRILILTAGALGGALALGQTLATGLIERLLGAPRVLEAAHRLLAQALTEVPLLSRLGALALPMGGEVLWLIVGLVVLAVALLLGRRIDGI